MLTVLGKVEWLKVMAEARPSNAIHSDFGNRGSYWYEEMIIAGQDR